jgi:hypothetical protein
MIYTRHPLSRPLRLVLALVLALAIENWVTIEWTWPTCNGGDNWVAAYGLPLPYTQWSRFSSMEYAWVPEIFALNIGALAATLYALLSLLPAFPHDARIYGVVAVVALLGAILNLLMLSITMVQSVESLAHIEAGESMWDLRPVAVHFDGYRRYECTPSLYWFKSEVAR